MEVYARNIGYHSIWIECFTISEKKEVIVKNNWFFFKYYHEIEMFIVFNC